ncbi:ABC transporter substrate-binding protein [Piscinibacter sakaiensis]|uniref:Putative gluthatione transporter, solute-binding component n=1 Tax=Piscinibacter sakaiensis TaxID=1547922 RepID=A0A0K8P6H7_PISS1|nr:ABC transporter substrate-binding protein [Piscinibacter sakaiensis]GAP38202.1 putative gluthatione transporter, solute-binding component [Piscinibacter sakaiensis]
MRTTRPPALRRLIASACLLATLATVGAARAQESFNWSTQAGIASLDPAAAGDSATRNVLLNVYESLVRQDRQSQIEPELAVSWTALSPTVLRFKLRPGVRFHGGEAFTAKDVVFSYKRSTSPSSDIRGKLRAIKDVRAVDDLTVDIEGFRPNPILLNDVAWLPVFSEEWATRNGAAVPADNRRTGTENHASRHANGTGPFKVAAYETDVKVELERNPQWWDRRSDNLKTATLLPIKSASTRVAALLSGRVDLIAPLPPQDEARVNATPGYTTVRVPEARVVYLGFDQAREVLINSSVKDRNPFKDVRVRRAFSRVIDTPLLQRTVMRGVAEPVDVLIPRGVVGWDPSFAERPPVDLALARQLLAEAGYPNGFSVTLDCPTEGIMNAEQLCVAVAGMLGKVGIQVNLAMQPVALHVGKLARKETSFFLHSWGTNLDAQGTMDMIMSTPNPAGGFGLWNVGSYSNEALDRQMRAAGAEMDPARRRQMVVEALRRFREDVGAIPLHQQVLLYGVSKKVQFSPRVDDAIQLRWVTVK